MQAAIDQGPGPENRVAVPDSWGINRLHNLFKIKHILNYILL